jgi:hypothetical protein
VLNLNREIQGEYNRPYEVAPPQETARSMIENAEDHQCDGEYRQHWRVYQLESCHRQIAPGLE